MPGPRPHQPNIMARFTRTIAWVVAEPRPLYQELARFESDGISNIPTSSRAAIASTVLTAVRHALRTGDGEHELASKETAMEHDIRDLVPSLHVHAKKAAQLRKHRSPADAEARAHRFVEWLTGGRRFDERSRVDWPCPPAMLPLVVHATPVNARSQLALLHRLSVLAGVQEAPQRFPSYETLVQMVLDLEAPVRAGISPDRDAVAVATQRVASALSCYRIARKAMLENAAADAEREAVRTAFAPCPKPPVGRAVHIGVHEEVHELARTQGLAPDEMTAFGFLRAVNPALAEDYELWRDGPGREQSESFVEQCEDALVRVGGWAVTAGQLAEFRNAEGLDDLFAMQIESARRVKLSPRELREARKRGTAGEELSVQRVSLLESLVEAAAPGALARSTVAADDVPLKDGKPYLVYSLYATCTRLWSMTHDLYAPTAGQRPESAQRWALASANWGHLLEELKARRLKGEYIRNAKDKEKLVKVVTLPQLLCIAFPLRRRELRALKARWHQARADALAKGHDPDSHAAVNAAGEAYLTQAARHVMLAITLDDGMRRKQYLRGRLGYHKNFHPIWHRCGARPNGAIEGIKGLQTNWDGNKSDHAHFKVRERGKSRKLDTRYGRDVRPGTVDMEILWDVISLWRPRQLVRAGLVPSLAAYDLETDMREGQWALFPSYERTSRADNSRTDVSEKVGRELHYLVRTFLRPPVEGDEVVPAWDALDESWRCLWAQHVTRLLNTSYIGGVRGDWEAATYLMKDTEQTLKNEYSVVNSAIKDKLGFDVSNWEHPNAFDAWMDRLLKGREAFDPLDDPALPLPEHVRQQLDAERAGRRRGRRPGGRVHIRQHRPEQVPPRAGRRVAGAPNR